MIIMNVNVKAQTLNNVITDKNSFGPVGSGVAGSNYTIMNDSLYLISGPNINIPIIDTAFKNVVFMYNDVSHNMLYIGTQSNGLYMYNPMYNTIVHKILGTTSGNITGYVADHFASNINLLYISMQNRIQKIDLLNSSITNSITNTIYKNINGVTSLEYNNNDSTLIYSIGSTVYKDKSATGVQIGSSNTYTYTINDMEFFNGSLYYATTGGIINITNTITVATGNYNIIKANNTQGYNDGMFLYFADTTGKIFNCDTLNNVTPMSYNTTNTVSKVNSITYVQTWDSPTNPNNYYLWVSTDKGLFIDIADSIASNPSIFNRLGSFTPSPATGTNTATSINESVLENTSGLYPVPNNGSFSYKTNYAGTLQIINISGQVVFEQKLEEGVTKVEMSLDNGIYVAQFNCEQGKVNKKFMVIN